MAYMVVSRTIEDDLMEMARFRTRMPKAEQWLKRCARVASHCKFADRPGHEHEVYLEIHNERGDLHGDPVVVTWTILGKRALTYMGFSHEDVYGVDGLLSDAKLLERYTQMQADLAAHFADSTAMEVN